MLSHRHNHPSHPGVAHRVESVADLRNGDLIFARLEDSTLGRLIVLTDDPFHHMGLVVDDGEPTVVEFTFAGCSSRTVAEFVDHYDHVGVLRLDLTDTERDRIGSLAMDFLGAQPAYGWDEGLIIGFTALLREYRNVKYSLDRGPLLCAIEETICVRNMGKYRAVICSSFVVQVFYEAGVSLHEVFGPFAPEAHHIGPKVAATPRDRTMAWPLRAQIALNVGLFVGTLARAALTTLATVATGRNEDPVPLSGPSDFWRHTNAVQRFEFPSSSPRGSALAPGEVASPIEPALRLAS